jgi:multisubunit Na+/H+ antiporter MnhB subunit
MSDWLFWDSVTFIVCFVCYFVFWLSKTPKIRTEYKFLITSELLTLLVVPFFNEAVLLEVFWFSWHILWYIDPFKLRKRRG